MLEKKLGDVEKGVIPSRDHVMGHGILLFIYLFT